MGESFRQERWLRAGGRRALLAALVVAGFAAVLVSRALMIYSPYFEEIQYERAPMGLEALAILRGETPVMNWSEPYHGTVFSYLLAPFYALGKDPILTYSWVSVCANLLGAVAAFLFARRLWGTGAGLAALVYLALAPAYFAFYDVNSYALFVTLGGVGCFAALEHLRGSPSHPRWIWLCGWALGTAVWCHQLGVCFGAAVGLGFVASKRSRLFDADLLRLVLGFVLGAAPLLAWNAVFHWIVLRNFTSTDYAARTAGESIAGFWESIGSLLAANTQFWGSTTGALPWMLYGQAIFVGLVGFAIWQWLRCERSRLGIGMLLVLVATTVTLYSKSRWGVNAGFSRYLIPLCFAVPILAGGAVEVARRRSRLLAAALLAALVLPGIHDRWQYARWGEYYRGKGAKTGVAALDRLGITRAYAHDRISLPLTLASRERIVVSDYYGIPHLPYLDAVDDAPDAAIVAHKVLQIPSPEDVVRSLPVLHGEYRRAEAGPYVIFYDWKPPRLTGGWLSSRDWKVSASTQPAAASAITDRDLLTVWSTEREGKRGDWIAIDLGAAHQVEEVHLLSGVRIHDTPGTAAVETSLDGESWTERQRLVAVPWYWWNGHPKHDDNGRASFYFDPVDARYVRVRLLGPTVQWNWSVAEVFLRAADVPQTDAGMESFRAGLLAERRGFVGINYHSIHAAFAPDADSTPWGEVMRDYFRAMRADPDNPEFSYRFAKALWVNGFLGPTASGRDALRYEQLGLTELAGREFAACAETDDSASLCIDRALAETADSAEKARLATFRKSRFEPGHAIGASFGPVSLAGAGTASATAARGSKAPLELFWKCDEPLERNYTVFVHFDGPGRFQSDHVPAGGRLPTTSWVTGETIRDAFEVAIPPNAPPGVYTARVGLWDPSRHTRLRRGWFGKSAVAAFTLQVTE